MRSQWDTTHHRSHANTSYGYVNAMNIDFPFWLDARKRTAVVGENDHIRDLIEQLVLTGPGERVNRPSFGSGLQQIAFAPSSPELAAAVQFLVQGALEQYLGDLIEVEAVRVNAVDASLEVNVSYLVRRTHEHATAKFSREI